MLSGHSLSPLEKIFNLPKLCYYRKLAGRSVDTCFSQLYLLIPWPYKVHFSYRNFSQGHFLLCLTYQNTNLIKGTYLFKISWVIDFPLWNHMEFAKFFWKHFTINYHIYFYSNFPLPCTIIRINIYGFLKKNCKEWIGAKNKEFFSKSERKSGRCWRQLEEPRAIKMDWYILIAHCLFS